MYDVPERENSCVGTSEEVIYSSSYDDDGNIVLDPVGVKDIRAEIDSYRESCDLNVILARYQNGDVNALNRSQGFYSDVTGIPNNLIDMSNLLNKLESEFNGLPVKVKEEFDNSFSKYLATLGKPEKMLAICEKLDFVSNSTDTIAPTEGTEGSLKE